MEERCEALGAADVTSIEGGARLHALPVKSPSAHNRARHGT